MLTEADARMAIDKALENKGWKLTGRDKNVRAEYPTAAGVADYVLFSAGSKHPLMVVEAKRKGRDLNEALKQAANYARALHAPIVYASDGSTIKTLHLGDNRPLILNGEEVDEFLGEALAWHYRESHEYNTLSQQLIQSRKELIRIFTAANNTLRQEGLQAGLERFREFCNILFLKLFSEQEAIREEMGETLRIKKVYRWDAFKDKEGDELLSYVNDSVLGFFQDAYGEDIFSKLQIRQPATLEKIIEDLDPLSLTDINSDIKGDAFEYFLKAYLANQHKDLGEYFTPRHLVKTLVKLVNPQITEKVYDPFCGTGGMLIEAFRHVYSRMPRSAQNLKTLKNDTIYGSEITQNAYITKMNMILTGDGHNNIQRIDSLKYPSEKKYDVVITNMPFSLGSYEAYKDNYVLGSSNGDSLCIEHCFDAIDPESSNPRVGIIVPEGILFDRKFKKLREYIYQNSEVKNIISLPPGTFKPYTEVKTNILYLTNVKKRRALQKSVWYFTVKNDGYTLNTKRQKKAGENDLDVFLSYSDSEDEQALLHQGFSKLEMDALQKNDYISLPNPYRKFEFSSAFLITPLRELVEEIVLRNDQRAPVWSVTNDEGFVLAQTRFKEKVASEDTRNYKLVLPGAFAYSPPRINVGSIAFNGSEVTGCVSPMYVVLKIKDENRMKSEYLYWLLQSDQLKEQIKFYAFGSVRQTLKFENFCRMTVPVPSALAQQEIVKELDGYQKIIDGAKQIIENWKPHFECHGTSLSLSEVCMNIIGGGTPPTANPNYWNGDIPWITSAHIDGYGNISIEKYITVEGLKASATNLVPESSVLVVTRVGIGKVAVTDFDLCINQDIQAIIVDTSKVLPKFLLYLLLTQMESLQAHGRGTTIKGITKDFLKSLSIRIPTLDIQRQIVQRLEKESQLIESQKALISLFEQKIKERLDALW